MYILGIDIGTTKIAGVLLELPENRIVKVLSKVSRADIASSPEWERIQDPEVIVDTAAGLIGELKEAAEQEIRCIGISSQMHGFVYVDNRGLAAGPLYTWQDNRAAIPIAPSGDSALKIIREKTGKSIFAGYALATHYYNTLQGLQPAEPCRISSIGGYLGMRLCGLTQATIDPSEAASFGLYDQDAGEFYLDDIKALWGSIDFLPRRVPFFSQMGREADGIPVFQSLGDNQASFYGAMQGREEKLLLNLGTGGQVSLLTDQIPPSLVGLERRPYPEQSLVVGSTLAGGKAFDLLVDFYSQVLSFFGSPLSRKNMYDIIDQAELSAPRTPLRVEPFFNGTRQDPALRGSIKNIDLDNLTPENLLYGFAEAMVGELRELLRTNGLDQEELLAGVVGSGNGIRRNPLVCRLIERLFDCRLSISDLKEEAACGAAFYAREGLEQ